MLSEFVFQELLVRFPPRSGCRPPLNRDVRSGLGRCLLIKQQGFAMRRFKDKVILITGAGSGIGAATAKRFASEGAKLALVDIADLGDISAAIGKDAVLAITADVTDAQQVNHMVARTVDHFGRLDVLVNNAGVYSGGDPATISDEDWRKVIATDLDGVFYGCRAAVSHLEKTKGSIVNTPRFRAPAATGTLCPTMPPKVASSTSPARSPWIWASAAYGSTPFVPA